MAQHIVLMSVVAPTIACLVASRVRVPAVRHLAAATTVQMVAIWFWHAPPVLPLLHFMPMHVVAQLSLLLAATWFWSAVFAIGGNEQWRPILALLVTSKLFCLLGVLLVFSPRALYSGLGHAGMPVALEDQQLAGLMMIVACPLTYLLAGLISVARWFTALERTPARGPDLADG